MSHASSATMGRRLRRTGAAMALAIALAGVAAPAALAAKPVTVPLVPETTDFEANSACVDPIQVVTPQLRGTTTTFPTRRDGSSLILTVGYGTTRVTNVATGASYTFGGAFLISIVTFRDGSVRADAFGPNVWAYYFAGDPSQLGIGLFQIKRHATEKYGADESFISATASGPTVDLCAKVGSARATA